MQLVGDDVVLTVKDLDLCDEEVVLKAVGRAQLLSRDVILDLSVSLSKEDFEVWELLLKVLIYNSIAICVGQCSCKAQLVECIGVLK